MEAYPEKYQILTKISYWRSAISQTDSISERKYLRGLIAKAKQRIKEGKFLPDTLTLCTVKAKKTHSKADPFFTECFNKIFQK